MATASEEWQSNIEVARSAMPHQDLCQNPGSAPVLALRLAQAHRATT
ncbi:hypothetical protein [Streptomyces sp. NBC_00454]